jgi:hypothetical protein
MLPRCAVLLAGNKSRLALFPSVLKMSEFSEKK